MRGAKNIYRRLRREMCTCIPHYFLGNAADVDASATKTMLGLNESDIDFVDTAGSSRRSKAAGTTANNKVIVDSFRRFGDRSHA